MHGVAFSFPKKCFSFFMSKAEKKAVTAASYLMAVVAVFKFKFCIKEYLPCSLLNISLCRIITRDVVNFSDNLQVEDATVKRVTAVDFSVKRKIRG